MLAFSRKSRTVCSFSDLAHSFGTMWVEFELLDHSRIHSSNHDSIYPAVDLSSDYGNMTYNSQREIGAISFFKKLACRLFEVNKCT